MPQREEYPVGAPCWVELYSSDTDRSGEFYHQLFGWEPVSAGERYGGYINFVREDQGVAGCMANDGASGQPDVWSVYLTTDDAKATTDAAAANGGRVIVAAMQVMDLGTMAVVTDPGGATIGVWQPGVHKGFPVLGEPGTPAWFELLTRDYDASVDYYTKVFEWDAHVMGDTPEFRYTTYGEGDGQMAGIMDASSFLPEGIPAHWSVYFSVEDTDAALDRVVELGGVVVQPAEDTPYGRLAAATDPTGARFKLVTGP